MIFKKPIVEDQVWRTGILKRDKKEKGEEGREKKDKGRNKKGEKEKGRRNIRREEGMRE